MAVEKKYRITRPLDLTIPVIRKLNNFNLNSEIKLIQGQIKSRNFSGVNKMLYNLLKFQNIFLFLKKEILFLIFLNQFNFLKFRLKKFIFRFICLNS